VPKFQPICVTAGKKNCAATNIAIKTSAAISVFFFLIIMQTQAAMPMREQSAILKIIAA
jgi:hypothetical protein